MLIESFAGHLDINGETHEITFEQNVLTISGLTFDQAMAFLKTGTLHGGESPPLDLARSGRTSSAAPNRANIRPEEREEAPPRRVGPPMPKVDESAVASVAATTKPKEKPEKPAAAPKAEAKKPPPPPPSSKAQPEEEAEVAEDDIPFPENADVIPPKAASPSSKAESPAPKKSSANGSTAPKNGTANGHGSGLPDEVRDAKKLKDVVVYLMDKEGLTDEQEIAKRCEELKSQVPMLLRISNIPDRVARTIEVMEKGEDVT